MYEVHMLDGSVFEYESFAEAIGSITFRYKEDSGVEKLIAPNGTFTFGARR